jgi:hypothetical protein
MGGPSSVFHDLMLASHVANTTLCGHVLSCRRFSVDRISSRYYFGLTHRHDQPGNQLFIRKVIDHPPGLKVDTLLNVKRCYALDRSVIVVLASSPLVGWPKKSIHLAPSTL